MQILWLASLRRFFAAVALALPVLASAQSADKPFTAEQLDQLLAPVALYPDSLLSQVLMASTYPDEFAQAAAWSKANPNEKGDEAVQKVADKDWDTSVASLVAFPEVLVSLSEKPENVKTLGDAFLAQPDDVMDSVQRLRAAAQKAGNLKSNEQIKVTTEAPPPKTETTVVVQQAPPVTQTIIIEPAQPTVVYVPYYNPTVVYGPWWWPAYPPYYYPYPPGYWWSRPIATGIAWGVSIGISNALWGGFHWGRRDIDIDIHRHNNININKRIDVDANRVKWTHNSEHRKAPYRGGDAQRARLDQRREAVNREQFRGKAADRDAGRDRAQAAMEKRGVEAPKGSARDRAQAINRDEARGKAPAAAKSVDRQKVQSADRDAARQRASDVTRDNALQGAGSSKARAEQARGNASAQRASAPQRAAPKAGGGGGGGGRERGNRG